MFGERIDAHITMLQRVVALLRDLILGVTVVFASIIIYFGGDTSTLNVLDYFKLVGAATLIVVGPIVAFAVVWLFLKLLHFVNAGNYYIWLDDRVPRGIHSWFQLKYKKVSKRDYVTKWRRRKLTEQNTYDDLPRIKSVWINALKLMRGMEKTLRWYPYLYAVIALVLAVIVFKETLDAYI